MNTAFDSQINDHSRSSISSMGYTIMHTSIVILSTSILASVEPVPRSFRLLEDCLHPCRLGIIGLRHIWHAFCQSDELTTELPLQGPVHTFNCMLSWFQKSAVQCAVTAGGVLCPGNGKVLVTCGCGFKLWLLQYIFLH